jgi:hypothetical protein
MDELRQIFSLYSLEELNAFKNFCQRNKHKRNRKDLQLLDFLTKKKEEPKEVFINDAYNNIDSKSKEAYFTLRKKLYNHLIEFIANQALHQDINGANEISGYIALANHLFKHQHNTLAWKHLSKAEHLSKNNQNYGLLKKIYLVQIAYADTNSLVNIEDLIQKKQTNDIRIAKAEQFQIALSVIKHQVLKSKKSSLDILDLITKVFKKFKITDDIFNSPKQSYILLNELDAIIDEQHTKSFAKLLEFQFKTLFEGFGFDNSELYYKVKILLRYLKTLLALKDTKKCLHLYIAYAGNINGLGKMQLKELYPAFKLLHIKGLILSKTYDKATELAVQTLNHPAKYFIKADRYAMQLLHIQSLIALNKKDEAKQLHHRYFNHSNQFYKKSMGENWVKEMNSYLA